MTFRTIIFMGFVMILFNIDELKASHTWFSATTWDNISYVLYIVVCFYIGHYDRLLMGKKTSDQIINECEQLTTEVILEEKIRLVKRFIDIYGSNFPSDGSFNGLVSEMRAYEKDLAEIKSQ